MPNRNTFWAEVFVDELARSGVKAVCAAPGSRHTPLMLAFARHDKIRVYSHLDERSAGFFALGLALGADEPVILVCSSGTAGANFFPAVIEAHQSRVPLIVLTADRPHELRHSGANQTIDQIKLYGDYVLWAVDAALPEAVPPAVALRNLRTMANRAAVTANGLRKGVVHINFPFRKPLEPTPVPGDLTAVPDDAAPRAANDQPFAAMAVGRMVPSHEQVVWLASQVAVYERGLIVCGLRCPKGDFPQAVSTLAEYAGYPLLADPLSGVRFSHRNAISAYDTFLQGGHVEPPDFVIRFGDVPLSKHLNAYLNDGRISQVIQIQSDGVWADDAHRTTAFMQVDEAIMCRALEYQIEPRSETAWVQQFNQLEAKTKTALDDGLAAEFSEAAIVADVVELIPPDSTLFMGNSMPVRHLDRVGRSSDKQLFVHANRGASGIDGNTSTALGLGAVRPDHPLVLVTGDITLYHDMNGLLAVQRLGIPVTVVLLNNNGGGIFHKLPIRDYDPEFTEYFVTPHDLDFSHTAALYGLDYFRVTDRAAFAEVFMRSVQQHGMTLINVDFT